ncbi:adenylate/guanylate cyclase domain-containing protein [Micrococcus lacusdianchii]|uniref:adenylate/guanylate cyclase domain-containing protein n=1 Tax=Micrococcus lacusdianchii TaxID=2915940 RepID=UPI0020068F67|nr:adenylate/guanylate cyclase domain-containing protein [Micrococcus sp. JXJ CY 30]
MTRHRPDPATPATAPLPVVPSPDGPRAAAGRPRRTPAPVTQPGWTSAMRTLDAGLVVGPRAISRREAARRLGVTAGAARRISRALGYPDVPDEETVFSEEDLDAFDAVLQLVREGILNEDTAVSLARSVGQMTDRMVVWQIEALVEDQISSEGRTDPEARRAAVDLLPEIISPLEKVMQVVYRRQLNNAVQRLTVRVEAGLAASEQGRDGSEDDAPLPLARAVGFADMVSYTTLSRTMGERTLARMVQRFESKAAEIIAAGGGWLVKTVGDEVLFNAETPEAGAEIALALSDAMAADRELPSARVSLAWGRVLSRLGDIYGPTVNLASRLTSLADPGTVLVDAMTAAALSEDERFVLVPQPPRIVRGFGEVRPSLLMNGSAQPLITD